MKKLLDELAPMIEGALARSELVREAAGGGTLILPREALYILNKLRRLADEETLKTNPQFDVLEPIAYKSSPFRLLPQEANQF